MVGVYCTVAHRLGRWKRNRRSGQSSPAAFNTQSVPLGESRAWIYEARRKRVEGGRPSIISVPPLPTCRKDPPNTSSLLSLPLLALEERRGGDEGKGAPEGIPGVWEGKGRKEATLYKEAVLRGSCRGIHTGSGPDFPFYFGWSVAFDA